LFFRSYRPIITDNRFTPFAPYKDNSYYLSHEYKEKTKKRLVGIVDKISEGIKLLGEKVSQEIVDLEDKQMGDLIWHEVSDGGWVGFSFPIKGRSGGWDPDLSQYAWNPLKDSYITTGSGNKLHELIKNIKFNQIDEKVSKRQPRKKPIPKKK
jgi:hypothetical protein